MSLRLSKKELLILLASILVVVGFILGTYYLYLNPKKQEVSNKQDQLKTEEQLLAAIQTKIAGATAPLEGTVAELQKKVPVKQQLEQLILDLNKAEVMSKSFIANMSFAEGDVAARAGTEPATAETPATTEGTEETTVEAETVEPVADEQQYQPIPLPEGIKKLSVNLSVTSPGYKELMKFLDALEGLNRRIVIESVAFSGTTELTNVEVEQQEFSYSITLAAFYMPELEDLEDQLPELEVPAPGNKSNPFASSADLTATD
ncbi:type IV pilus assembly protein PilO [Mesobacillus persicus]|uniref:Type IV pilus assembly protein PilO n=1 Tax=Mesobacillus persicus TaxID=930146 RepID=A0A1H7XH60_9BACI|nr:hypothetical protein [Mesobacillus persicus]SEM33136.1 type IV pilus assembly protein PilO [Mesobacillus persicus]